MAGNGKNGGIIVLGAKADPNGISPMYGDTVNFEQLLSETDNKSLGDMGFLYDLVSNPETHIKEKINALLKLHMFYSKEVLTSAELTSESVAVYRVRKEAVADLKRLVELLNEYSSVDNFDVEHPLFNKSLTFIIEAILTAIKSNTETSQFDSIVREVAIALPTVESRIKNMVQDSSTEEILALRDNPLMDALNEEKKLFLEYIKHRPNFLEYLGALDE